MSVEGFSMKIRILSLKNNLDFHSKLEPNIWHDNKLAPRVRDALIKIAEEIFVSFDIPSNLIEDIRFTGSLANYNYTQYSDIDLHVVVDFVKVSSDTELVKKLFDSKRVIWNKNHAITIKGYEVEVYIENFNEKHISTGVYSVTEDEWIAEPPSTKPKVDVAAVAKKVEQLTGDIDEAIAAMDKNTLARTKEKIKKMRQCGLEDGGEYSVENLAFKALRRNGYIKKLHDAYTKEYDKSYSLPEVREKT
jgi:hypothetical protein